ncbi:MAG TPA: hypothetical protein PKA28_07620 [Methylomusa anaerophila]|uniref:Uncharacterized protein n=1 Tax=Methylomusa anaerophila TaxID=1930071 RepID=A0A348AFX4_9FIRM|nr:hypothetical protein [Methylomusa anaerophila]BBB89972.1 hypothetical protein MAMMFC1_00613 [Methylomusa anaerophila]HML88300.1 hypothetical protein [Methylomusa anaerophila]
MIIFGKQNYCDNRHKYQLTIPYIVVLSKPPQLPVDIRLLQYVPDRVGVCRKDALDSQPVKTDKDNIRASLTNNAEQSIPIIEATSLTEEANVSLYHTYSYAARNNSANFATVALQRWRYRFSLWYRRYLGCQ